MDCPPPTGTPDSRRRPAVLHRPPPVNNHDICSLNMLTSSRHTRRTPHSSPGNAASAHVVKRLSTRSNLPPHLQQDDEAAAAQLVSQALEPGAQGVVGGAAELQVCGRAGNTTGSSAGAGCTHGFQTELQFVAPLQPARCAAKAAPCLPGDLASAHHTCGTRGKHAERIDAAGL